MSPMPNRGGTIWDRGVGRPYFNRVHVRQRKGGHILEMYWKADGKVHYRSLGRISRAEAVAKAMEKAEEIRKAKATHEPQNVILAMRSDLVRVARLLGLPDGYAPPRKKYYPALGQFSETRVRAAFRGYRMVGKHVNPRDGWGEAMERYGLKTAGSLLRGVTLAQAATDVRRVAMELGEPRRLPSALQYRKLGRYSTTTVMTHLRVSGWLEIASVLHLDVDPKRQALRDRMAAVNAWKRTPHEQRKAA